MKATVKPTKNSFPALSQAQIARLEQRAAEVDKNIQTKRYTGADFEAVVQGKR